MRDQPEPIRKSLPLRIPPSDSELHTWFPSPGRWRGPGARPERGGIHVRRRVGYGDWEPVQPNHWAKEQPYDTASAVAPSAPANADQQCTLGIRLTLQQADELRDAPAIPCPREAGFVEQHQCGCWRLGERLALATAEATVAAHTSGGRPQAAAQGRLREARGEPTRGRGVTHSGASGGPDCPVEGEPCRITGDLSPRHDRAGTSTDGIQ